jgi:zinc protease
VRRGWLAYALLAACGSAPHPAPASAPTEPPSPAATAAAAEASPAPATTTLDEPFRQHPPEALPTAPFAPPVPSRSTLRNGVPAVTVPVPSPFVAINVVASGGKADAGAARAEDLELMASMLHMGSTTRDGRALRDAYVTIGIPEPESGIFDDGVVVSVVGRVEKLKEVVDVAAELCLRPAFDAKMLKRVQERTANVRDNEAVDAQRVADRVLRRVLFGGHPYAGGHRSREAVLAVKRTDVVALHARLFSAARLSVVVAGGADEKAMLAAVDDAFGARPRGGPAVPATTAVRAPAGAARVVVVDRPGAIPYISAGFLGPTSGAPDEREAFAALEWVADGTLGTLTHELRDERGLVPWVAESHLSLRSGGMLAWRTRAAPDRVAAILTSAAAAFHALASAPPTQDDVVAYRERATFSFASQFVTAAGTARAYAFTFLDGQPLEYVTRRRGRLEAIGPAEVQRAAARWLDPSQMRVVVVGDWSALREPLTSLGWGTVELRDVDGALVRAGANARASR